MIKVRVVRTVRSSNRLRMRKVPKEFIRYCDASKAYRAGRISKEVLDKYEFHTYIKSFESVEDLIKWLNNTYGQYVPYLEEDLTPEEFNVFNIKMKSIGQNEKFHWNGTNWKRYQRDKDKHPAKYSWGFVFR